MIDKLDQKTLTRLYFKEKMSFRAIAEMCGRSYAYVYCKSQQYGLKPRTGGPKGNKIKISKSDLQSLYLKEGKSLNEIAKILSCSYTTVIKRCREYGITLRTRNVQKINREMLEKLYLREGKTTREIAKILGCSFETVRIKCKIFGIPLRNPGSEKVIIDELTFRRLYLKEGKNRDELARILGCSVSTIYQCFKRFGLNNGPPQVAHKINTELKQAQSGAMM